MTTLRWERDGHDWPNREASRFVSAAGLRWHVQDFGNGPAMLLVHGTGASTHSWRAFAPFLARSFRVIALDLPGHGFTEAPRSSEITLPYMAHAVGDLIRSLEVRPELAIGHSAGAAILCRMALDRRLQATAILSLNGALLPFGGFASQLFPAMARLLFLNPFVPSFFSWRANDLHTVRRLITGTGSEIDDNGLALYARLFRSPVHVASALGMMANWDLAALARDLPRLPERLTLIAASNDRAIPPDVAFKVHRLVPQSRVLVVKGLGHLAHEERPGEIAGLVLSEAARYGVLPDPAALAAAS
jgi:magnesium chelatase accessory protein